MARLPLIAQSVRRKRIGIALTIWLEICRIAIWFLFTMGASLSLQTYRPRIRSYTLDFYAKWDYVKMLVYASDETCIEQVRMNRTAFFKLCEMVESLGGLKSSRNMLVDERSGETVSRAFHSVLNAVIRLQDVLFKKAEPITTDSSDTRWKWFKNCLGALDGTHIKINVPTVDKPRYRTRKCDIATNMLGACTPDMQFVYVLPSWEGSVADGRVLRDVISRRHGLKVPHGCYYLVDARYTNCERFLVTFRGQRYHLNEWHQGYQPSVPQSNASSEASRGTKRKWVPEEDAALVSCMVDLHNVRTFNADTEFKASYLNELEKMLEKALPNAMLKAKPNIESRIRLLKREWSIVYDMLNGQNNSGFGWDEHRQLVVAEDAVWDSYLKAKPNIESRIRLLKREWSIVYDMLNGQNNSGFGWDEHRQLVVAEDAVWDSYLKSQRSRSIQTSYFPLLRPAYCHIRKRLSDWKDAQTAVDVLEEINAEDVPTTDMNEERNSFYDCKADVSLDDMDVSATEPRRDRDQGGSSSSNKKKKKSDARDNMSSSFNEAATLLAENMRAIGDQINRSIASDVVVQQKSKEFQIIQEKATNLYSTL
ncbi:hypothetical protein GOBAR_DD10466 [Gossypium barbadense]|nr:hypothetical protein GOBAR_DD10466 [Gossypium barbadense]